MNEITSFIAALIKLKVKHEFNLKYIAMLPLSKFHNGFIFIISVSLLLSEYNGDHGGTERKNYFCEVKWLFFPALLNYLSCDYISAEGGWKINWGTD